MACISKRRNRWVIDFYDNQGKRRWKTLPKGTTKARAKEAMREIEDQLARGIYLPEKKIPIFSEVARDWLEYKKPNLRGSTWSVYKGHAHNHFHDLNYLKINRITTARIEKFITDRQKQGMHINTLRKVLVSPVHHRAHHEVGPGKNFAGMFSFFDLLFGSYQEPTGAPHGAGEPISESLLAHLAWPFQARH